MSMMTLLGRPKRPAAALALAATLIGPRIALAAAPGPFDGWSLSGVGLSADGKARLAPASAAVQCAPDAVDGLQPAFDPGSGLCHATDPDGARYAGGDFAYGVMTSPVVNAAHPFQELVGSWDAVTPLGSWIELHVRVLASAGWSGWYALPVWTSDPATLSRHSVNGQKDALAEVDTDTLAMEPGQSASAYQVAVTLFSQSPDASPEVRLVHAAVSPQASGASSDRSAWGTELPVPQRSQMLPQYRSLGFGGGGEAWCSPTSTSMIMAYWGDMLHLPQLVLPVPTVAAGTYDYVYRGAGNWPFNTGFAAGYGLTSYVERFASFDQIEPWIKASVPVAISVTFRPGELAGAPIDSTPGHLIVVRGFTSTGDVIVNDPAAANDPAVRIVYSRAQLERVWQNGSHGTAYVIYPPGWSIPA